MIAERIALVTPWPPDHSGIADFSRDLAIGLFETGYEVVVYTNAETPTLCEGIQIEVVRPDWCGGELANFDHRLFQLGNNVEFHGWMLRAMMRHPGVVQIHDIVLHHLVAGLTCARGNWRDYLRSVRDWYGENAATRAAASQDGSMRALWETTEVVDFPFFEMFLEYAAGVVVHSMQAARSVARALPQVPLRQLTQTYRHGLRAPRQTLKRIGIFGGVHENKKLDWILTAFGYLDRLMDGIEVTVVGGVVPQCEFLIDESKALSHLSIRFIGRVEESMFLEELAQTDLCISLRHPTMGETSAVVMRAVQFGVPTIVNDTGWYAELPSDVWKAPLDNTPHFLSSALHRLISEPDMYRQWAERCARIPEELNISHGNMCAQLIDFMHSFPAERWASETIARGLVGLGFQGSEDELAVLGTIAPRTRLTH